MKEVSELHGAMKKSRNHTVASVNGVLTISGKASSELFSYVLSRAMPGKKVK